MCSERSINERIIMAKKRERAYHVKLVVAFPLSPVPKDMRFSRLYNDEIRLRICNKSKICKEERGKIENRKR
mgnify:CR=1 FL=1